MYTVHCVHCTVYCSCEVCLDESTIRGVEFIALRKKNGYTTTTTTTTNLAGSTKIYDQTKFT